MHTLAGACEELGTDGALGFHPYAGSVTGVYEQGGIHFPEICWKEGESIRFDIS
jgi:hypothetical protein